MAFSFRCASSMKFKNSFFFFSKSRFSSSIFLIFAFFKDEILSLLFVYDKLFPGLRGLFRLRGLKGLFGLKVLLREEDVNSLLSFLDFKFRFEFNFFSSFRF